MRHHVLSRIARAALLTTFGAASAQQNSLVIDVKN